MSGVYLILVSDFVNYFKEEGDLFTDVLDLISIGLAIIFTVDKLVDLTLKSGLVGIPLGNDSLLY